MSLANGLPVVFLLGPTASGKSAAALELACHLPVEIITVDSAQVFRGMDIGTAKPSREEQAAVPHHLIDIVDPTEAYSAAQFAHDAARLIDEIHARGRLPVLAGGTMLYVKALREGLSDLPEAEPEVRAALEAEAAERGWPAMHAALAEVDPVTAQRLKPNDSQRIQRALEVWRVSGQPLSVLQGARQSVAPSLNALVIALQPGERSVLHERIAQRFDAMLKAGLVEELRGLRARHALRPEMPSMRCVGYRQAWEYLDGVIDQPALRDQGIFATRQLAKRQLTWLRSTPDVEAFDCLRADLAQAVVERVLRWREASPA